MDEPQQKSWRVECVGEVREVYVVAADTEQEAMAKWMTGTLDLSEASSVEPVSASRADEE